MPLQLSPGKLAGLNAVSDANGVVAALALDQRGVLRKAIAQAKQVEDVPEVAVVEFKELVTSVLTRHASAILLDPEYGLSAAKRRNKAGLLLAYEQSCYDAPLPRMPLLYDHWSVRRVRETGADCVKVLLHYTPFERQEINDIKQAWVERIGGECRAQDIPLVLELLGYDLHGDEKSLAYAKAKPGIVVRSMEEFGRERYGVDLLKVEAPVQMKYVAGTRFFDGKQAYTQAEAREHFVATAAATEKPFVYLSAGVNNEQFVEALEFAGECGARFNGVLCGRATWQGGVAVFAQQGTRALEEWLLGEGTENINRINQALRFAQPWKKHH